MQKQTEVKQTIVKSDFTKLSDLTAKEVKGFIRVPVRLQRRVNNNGLNTIMNLVLNPTNLIIGMISNERVNGITRPLRFFKPERFINLIMTLGLDQKDERGLDVNQWVVNTPIRFVTGKTKNDDDYYSIEVVFKQFHYETIFLTYDQVSILNILSKQGDLKDFTGKVYKVNWVSRPDIIDDLSNDVFEF